MKKILILTFSLFFLSLNMTLSADTIRMMQYNLMYYTYNADYTDCDATTNNLDVKDYHLRKLIQYVKPDVFCVNEIGREMEWGNRLLQNVLNQDGVSYFATVNPVNSWSTIGNRIFYDSRKLVYYNAFYVPTSVININGFKFYFNSSKLIEGDTTFITFIVCHLKAGGDVGNETTRYQQTLALMNRLEVMGRDNYIWSGDFNSYSASDSGIANALYWQNPNFRFYDPVNQLGNWHDNENYAHYHSQSTHSGYNDACFSGGGLDDRFDFILVSPDVYTGQKGVMSINSSYQTLGQDGNRFNRSIINPTNSSQPSTVTTALHAVSDHLPIIMDIEVNTDIYSKINDQTSQSFYLNVINPIRDNVEIVVDLPTEQTLQFQIFSIEGKLLKVFKRSLSSGIQKITEDFNYSEGVYILRVTDKNKRIYSTKMIK